ncbi:hypothetical protein GCM10022262_32990 [Georgenia daeguensis]|uniref:Uncharacterized protein n=1 Tax=Georgenia daeguensis TaxID=908355 RepID=A0ABP8EY68_9MICO
MKRPPAAPSTATAIERAKRENAPGLGTCTPTQISAASQLKDTPSSLLRCLTTRTRGEAPLIQRLWPQVGGGEKERADFSAKDPHESSSWASYTTLESSVW